MKDFLYLIKRRDCCIHYKKLEEYSILKFDSSNKFKRIMDENNFKENINFEVANTGGLKTDNPKSR